MSAPFLLVDEDVVTLKVTPFRRYAYSLICEAWGSATVTVEMSNGLSTVIVDAKSSNVLGEFVPTNDTITFTLAGTPDFKVEIALGPIITR